MLASRFTETVYLNIYDVTSLNQALEFIGFGLYHTSVGMYGLEFSYGGHDGYSSGTVVVMKGNSAGLTLKESIPIGHTHYNLDEINDILKYMGEFWLGCDYDPFRRNCNSFTEKLVEYVCDKNEYYFPSYINRFTKMGTVFRMWFKPLQ
jgi:deubiquitinase DESI2